MLALLSPVVAMFEPTVEVDPGMVGALNTTIQTIVIAVLGVLGTVITGLLTMGAKKLMAWLDAKVQASGSEAHYAAFRCATEKLLAWSTAAVAEVEQTLVRKAKRTATWNGATARTARDTAVEIMLRHAGEKGMAELEQCLGVGRDVLLGMFRTYVERAVKLDGSSGGAAPVVAMGDDAAADLDP